MSTTRWRETLRRQSFLTGHADAEPSAICGGTSEEWAVSIGKSATALLRRRYGETLSLQSVELRVVGWRKRHDVLFIACGGSDGYASPTRICQRG